MTSEEVFNENVVTAFKVAALIDCDPFAPEPERLKSKSRKTQKDPGEPVTEQHRVFSSALKDGSTCSTALAVSGLPDETSVGVFYVYLLIDPRTDSVFYVGKGKGDRAYQHVKNAKGGRIDNGTKHRMIREIMESGKSVKVVILFRTENESLAYRAERYLIRTLALCGLSNISNGARSNAEKNLEEALVLRAGVAPLQWMLNGMCKDHQDAIRKVHGSIESYHTWIHSVIDDIIARSRKELESS